MDVVTEPGTLKRKFRDDENDSAVRPSISGVSIPTLTVIAVSRLARLSEFGTDQSNCYRFNIDV